MSVRNQLSDYELREFFRSLQDVLALSLDANLSINSVEFLSRRLDGFERALSVLSSRVHVSHPSERQLLSDLDILLHTVSQQRQYCVNLSYFAVVSDFELSEINDENRTNIESTTDTFSHCNTHLIIACSRRSDSGARAKTKLPQSPLVFFPLFRSLYISLALHYLNAWNRLI